MGAPRKLAGALLRGMVRLAPQESRDWATAMLRELGFIEGEWAALFWALGSATAILRHATSAWRDWRILGILFPGLEHSPWAYWLAVMAIPEAIFVAATVMLWRKKGPVAAGILATGLVMALHVAVHLTLHW
jgi:hypothetical protein